MKLIGSKAEQDFRKELIQSHESLFRDHEKRRMLKILSTHFPEMKTAYVLGWTPEQGEDIYRILINTDIIASIEINRSDSEIEPLIDRLKLNAYKKGLSKIGQIKLSVAIDLAKSDLKNR